MSHTAHSVKATFPNQNYFVALFFVLSSVGISIISLTFLNSSLDIRQQAQSPYCTTDKGGCCYNSDCKVDFICTGATTFSPGQCQYQGTKESDPNEKFVLNSPTPIPTKYLLTTKASPTPKSSSIIIKPTAQPTLAVKLIVTQKPEQERVIVKLDDQKKTIATQATATPKVFTPVTKVPQSVKTVIPEQKTTADIAQDVKTTANFYTKTTTSKEDTTPSALSRTASFLLDGIEGFNVAGLRPEGFNVAGLRPEGFNVAGLRPEGFNVAGLYTPDSDTPEGFSVQGLRPEGFSVAGLTIGGKQTKAPITASDRAVTNTQTIPTHTPPALADLVSKVTTIATLNTTQVKTASSNKKQDNVKVVISSNGKFSSYSLEVPKKSDGTVDQAQLESKVSELTNNTQKGVSIPAESMDKLITDSTKPQPSTVGKLAQSIGSLFSSKKTQEIQNGVNELKAADIIISTEKQPLLPVSAQQISLQINKNAVTIEQTKIGQVGDLLKNSITPVSSQLESVLSADKVENEIGNASKTSVTLSQNDPKTGTELTQLTASANQLAKAGNLDEQKIIQSATIQTLTRQLGASAAMVEYVTDNNSKLAYISAGSDNTDKEILSAASELTAAQNGQKTIGDQVEKYTQSTGVEKTLRAAAYQGIDTLANQNKLHVQVITVHTDLNQEKNTLNLSLQPRLALGGPKAVILVDDYGNMQIKVSGTANADKLQQDMENDPAGILKLINAKLEDNAKR